MRSVGIVVVVTAACLMPARKVNAQVSFDVGALYVSFSGADFQGVKPGIGVDGQVQFPIGPQAVRIGLGGQYTTHRIDGIDPNFNMWGVYAEPRYVFPPSARQVSLYFTGRFGYLHHRIASRTNTLSASGFQAGGGAGLLLGMGNVDLDLSFLFMLTNFGEQRLNGTGTGLSTKGTAIAMRAGVLLGGR
jgi:hypothetical protein